jgi:hypothetical protein
MSRIEQPQESLRRSAIQHRPIYRLVLDRRDVKNIRELRGWFTAIRALHEFLAKRLRFASSAIRHKRISGGLKVN